VAGDEIASEAWGRWVAELTKVDALRRVDFAVLALACSSYAHFRRIEVQLQAEIGKKGTGAYLSPTRDGTPTLNPLWRARDQAVAALHRTLRECGLTPSSEGNLGRPRDTTPPSAEDNPFG
jgi:P27 family predicted phage terminase small subunit